jgi:hypothetical protein
MQVEFKVSCDVSFTSGKFASAEDIESEIQSELENADPGSLSVNEGEYDVSDWTVEPTFQPSRKQLRRQRMVTEAQKQLIDAIRESIEQSTVSSGRVVEAFKKYTKLSNQ